MSDLLKRAVGALVVLLAVLFFLLLYACLPDAPSEAVILQERICADMDTQRHLRIVMQDGLDYALQEHMRNLFRNWVADDHFTSDRAAKGMTNGIRAYLHARSTFSQWAAPEC